jgi:serine/threonine-protein kinase
MGEAFATLGCIRGVYDWEWEAAENEFRSAVNFSPNYATAHQWHALQNLAPRGRFEDARASLKTAQGLDPLSPVVQASLAFLRFLERDFTGAESTLRGVLSRSPDFAIAHYFLAEACCQMGRHSEALQALERVVEIRGRTPETISALGQAHAMAGRRDEAERSISELRDRASEEYVSPTRIAQIKAALGDRDEAFEWLQRAHSLRATDLMWLDVHPAFDPLRDDPRMEEIRKDMGFG